MTVVDASVVIAAFADDTATGDRARAALVAAGNLVAPELLDVEFASAYRRLLRTGDIDDIRARTGLRDLAMLPLRRESHRPLLARIWSLRDTLTAYDAAYVALAELLGDPLITADAAIGRAPGIRCVVEVI